MNTTATEPVETAVEAPATVLILRTCAADLTAYGGFQWPESGPVECPDWDSYPKCGNGLHGLLWGGGDVSHLSRESDARWLVVEVEESTIVQLGGKVKFPRGNVRFCGAMADAAQFIYDNGGAGRPIAGLATTAGDSGTATAGGYGTATAGDSGTATAGDSGTATAGGYGTATAGYRGTATAGYSGTATAGGYGTATAGGYGTATAGDSGTATAGYSGTLILRWWDEPAERYRIEVAYVGENGIKADTRYRLNDAHEFEEVA